MKTSNIINKSQTTNDQTKKQKIAWLGKPESKILSIRKFRKYIDTIPFEDAVRETIDNWQAGPHFSKSLFDIADSDSWPAPWDLFGQNIFCDNSQVLGAFYTLILSEHAKNYNIAMAIVQDLLSGPQGQIIVAYNPLDLSNQNVVKIITSSDIQTKLGK